MSLTLYHGEPNGPSLTVLAALFESGAEADNQSHCQQTNALPKNEGNDLVAPRT